MGHSLLEYRNKTELLNDLDVIVVMNFMTPLIHQNSPKYRLLLDLAERWKTCVKQYGPGVIDLKLNQVLKGASHQEIFLELLQETQRQVSEFGEAIPATLLTQQNQIPGLRFSDYKTSFLLEAIDRLESLMTRPERL